MFGAAHPTTKRSEIEGLLGSMSPMVGSKPAESFSLGGGSKASAASGMSIDDDSAASARYAVGGGGGRAPFGELQNTSSAAFEFKPSSSTLGGAAHRQQQQPQHKPTFTFGGGSTAFGKAPAAASASAAATAGGLGLRGRKQQGGPSLMQAMAASPEPTTPASSGSTCEPRGGGGGGIARGGGPAGAPPLTTLHSLHAFGSAGADESAGSDNDTVTPLAPPHAGHVPLSTPPPPVPVMPRKQLVLADVLLWQAPLQTATIFAGGLLAFWALNFAAFGAHRFSVVSGLSYILLLDLSANFFRYFVSQKWHDQCLWGGAAQMKHFLTKVNAYVLHLAAAHDRFLSAVDPFVTLKVAVALWATAWIGSYLSLWWCVLLGYVGAFTVPVTYHACKGQLAAAARVIRAHTVDRVDATGLPRTARFLGLVAAVAALWFTASFTQSAIGFFVALAYWRTLLAPREIDVIRTVAEPYTVSAFKVGRRISTAASDAFDRMSTAGPKTRTKSHFGSKARAE